MMALVEQFTNTDYDVLLYDPQSSKNRRGEFVANMVKESGAQGLVLFMQQERRQRRPVLSLYP